MGDMTSSMSQKGQVTIPAEVRKRLGLRPKDRVRFRVQGDTVSIEPYRSNIDAWYQTVPALDPLDHGTKSERLPARSMPNTSREKVSSSQGWEWS